VTLGHRYWLLNCRHEGEFRPGYHDISVDMNEVVAVVEQVDEQVDACR
jgi:hypothetical protein